jgi:ribonucleoside-diphosphate reductase alpha chain
MINKITKRDGTVVDFDVDKINTWAEWAAEECGVSWSDVIFKAIRSVHEEVASKDLHQALIDACLSYRTEGHTKMAARLLVGDIYKEAFGDFSIPHLREYYKDMVDGGWWMDMEYTDEELDYLDTIIDHTRDFTYSYATLKQYSDKYGIKSNGVLLESPQMTFMGIAMANMAEDTLQDVVNAYNAISLLKINLPTPTVALERTPQLPAPSCCVISGKDTVESIGVANHVAYTMTAKSSGIGVELETRAPKDPVKNGKIEHAGKYGYYALLDRAVKANRQAVRGGSATVTFHCLDPEVDKLLTMKQQRTDPSYRLDLLDYSFAVNDLFLKKVAKNEQWMLVSPYYAKTLWDLSYKASPEEFEQEYERVLADKKVKKRIVSARDIMDGWIRARGDTGRVYITFLDNINQHTPFKDPIRLSNLCQEVLLPTAPYEKMEDLYSSNDNGEVALCNLGSVVVSNIDDDADYERVAYILAKITDNTIENGVYPFPQVEYTAKNRRSIGIGMTDLAHLMAKNNLKYDTVEGFNFIHELAEKHSYFLHKASVKLAKERGKCGWIDKTKYVEGWLPIDSYKKTVDMVHTTELKQDWEGLRKDVLEHGVRFSVLESMMPTESSSVLTNSCNGVYPVRDKEIWKKSKKGSVYFRAPDMDNLAYQNAFSISDKDMVKVYAVIQKFTGQGISADFYSVVDGDASRMSKRDMLQRVFNAAKLGMSTFYYENFRTGKQLEETLSVEEVDDSCESCKL